MSKSKRFIVLPNNVVWDDQLNEVVCRCILEGIGDAENVCQRLNELETKCHKLKEENRELRHELDKFKPVLFKDILKGTVILYSKGDE